MTQLLSKSPYQGVFFDLDGTLIDSAPDIAAALNIVLVETGRAPLTVWRESARAHPPQLKMNAADVDIEFCEIAESRLQRYGIDLNEGLPSGTISASAKQPLAFNQFLIDAAQRLGMQVDVIDVPWGGAIPAGEIGDRLKADPTGAIKAVAVVHNETATGVTSDIAAVRAVRNRIPAGVALMVDYNQALTLDDALERGRALDQEDIAWLEEPIRHDDYAGAAELKRALDVPIQIGENFSLVAGMRAALDANCCNYVMPDLERIGGVTGWLRAAALAHPEHSQAPLAHLALVVVAPVRLFDLRSRAFEGHGDFNRVARGDRSDSDCGIHAGARELQLHAARGHVEQAETPIAVQG